jgi:hypothetical protein
MSRAKILLLIAGLYLLYVHGHVDFDQMTDADGFLSGLGAGCILIWGIL